MIAKAGLKTAQAFAEVRVYAEKNSMKFVQNNIILQAQNTSQSTDQNRQVGYIVSRKCGNAVHRNRIKRRLRAAMAQAFMDNHQITDGKFVLIGRKKAYDCDYADLLKDIKLALQKYDERKQLL